MKNTSRHDAWSAGDSYDAYMGRWSRLIAERFLEWIDVREGLDWLEIGCGTGALSSSILARCDPASLIGVEPSEGFVEAARRNVPDQRAGFHVGDAEILPIDDSSRDIAVSALVLNFVPDKQKALSEMVRVLRPGGAVAFYVWDYPGGGVEFMQSFWDAAASLDPAACDLAEDKRFPDCTQERLIELADSVGLKEIKSAAIEVPTIFTEFEDYWHPFTLGAGPAPGYCLSLESDARQRLKKVLQDCLLQRADGSIALNARAWAINAEVP